VIKETNLKNNYHLCYLSIIGKESFVFEVTLNVSSPMNFIQYVLGTYQYPRLSNEYCSALDLDSLDKIVDKIFSLIDQLGYELDITKLSFKNDLIICHKHPYLSQNIYVTVNKFPKTQFEIDEDNCLLVSKLIPDDEKYLKSLINPKPKSLFERIMSWRLK